MKKCLLSAVFGVVLFAFAEGATVTMGDGRVVYVHEANYTEANIPAYTLENPLEFVGGSNATNAAQWENRRREILDIFAHEVYGVEPPAPEALVVEKFDEQIGTDVIRRMYHMWFKSDRSGPCVNWIVWIPRNVQGRVPVISWLNYRGNHELVPDADIPVTDAWLMDWTDKYPISDHCAHSEYRGIMQDSTYDVVFPLTNIIQRGYAVMSACYGEVSRDQRDPSKQLAEAYNGVFDLWGERDNDRTDNITALGAWAWTLSRGMDLAEQIPEIDARRSVVTGYSRLGKAALIAAARDKRFAVCVPNQTGGGGVTLSKRDYGENISTMNRNFTHWYCKKYATYAENPHLSLTFDQHLLVASIAPRAVLVEGFNEAWFDTKGEFLSAQAASPVWKTLVGAGLPNVSWPNSHDTSAIGTYLGYVRREGTHGLALRDWNWLLDFADGAMESVCAAPPFASAASSVSNDSFTVSGEIVFAGGTNADERVDVYFASSASEGDFAYAKISDSLACGAAYTNTVQGVQAGERRYWSVIVSNELKGAVYSGVVDNRTFNEAPFERCCELTVSGYNRSSPLERFPVLVRLSENSPSGFSYADCAADGSDLRFTDADGKLIPHEIDTWNASGESCVWVRLPLLDSSSTSFTMYWKLKAGQGSPALPSTDVWVDYIGVWHMGQDNNVTKDSTANGIDGTKANAVDGGAVSKVGRSSRVTSNVDAYTTSANQLTASSLAQPLKDQTRFSCSGWMKASSSSTTEARQLFKKSKGDVSPGWYAGVYSQDITKFKMDGNVEANHALFAIPNCNDDWVYFDGVYDNTSFSLYANGEVRTRTNSGTLTAAADNTANCLVLGQLNGYLDELRIRNGVTTADRAWADYQTQVSSSFVTFGGVRDMNKPFAENFSSVGAASFTVSGEIISTGGDDSDVRVDVYFAASPTEGEFVYEKVASALQRGDIYSATVKDFSYGERRYWSIIASNDFDGVAYSGTVANETYPFWSFGRSCELTVSGYNRSMPLERFPVLVRLQEGTPSGFSYADCAAGGADLRFTDADGNLIPHEIDTWNTSGESCVWVLLPVLANAATEPTRFKMNWKLPSGMTLPALPSTDVWVDYVGVWHMGQDNNVTKDSTANGIDGTTTVASNGDVSKVGRSSKVTSKANIYSTGVTKLTASSLVQPLANAAYFSCSGWLKSNDSGNQGRQLMKKASGSSNLGWYACVYSGGITQFKMTGATEAKHALFSVPNCYSGWVYFDAVFDNTSFSLYANGEAKTRTDSNAIDAACDNTNAELILGELNGYLDELRIRNGVTTAERAWADYQTQTSASFLSFGAVQELDSQKPFTINSTSTDASTYTVSGEVVSAGTADADQRVDVYFAFSATDGDFVYAKVASGISAGGTYSATVQDYNRVDCRYWSVIVSNDVGSIVYSGAVAAGAMPFSPFERSCELSVDGYTKTSVIERFPVLVRLSENSPVGFSYADCAANGADLRFTDADGNLIPHEIDTWNTSGESCVWVLLPRLEPNSTKFMMYWKLASGMSSPSLPATDVWVDYVGVWHMGQDNNVTKDSTANGIDGTSANASDGGALSKVGRSSQVAGSNADAYTTGVNQLTASSFAQPLANAACFSCSGWMRSNNSNSEGRQLFKKGWFACVFSQDICTFKVTADNDSGFATFTIPSCYNNWVYLNADFNNTTYSLYANGEPKTRSVSGTCTAAADNTAISLVIGQLSGYMDEFRIRNGVTTADRAWADYQTQASASFLSFGEVSVNSVGETPVLYATATPLTPDNFTVKFDYKTWSAGPSAETVALYYAVRQDAATPTEWTLIDETQIGTGRLLLDFDQLGVTNRVWFKAVGDGTTMAGPFTVEMPPPSGLVAAVPIVDKQNKTIRFTGAIDPVGGGMTTLTLEYGATAALGTSTNLVVGVEYGSSPVAFDSGEIACNVPDAKMRVVYYRYVLVETVDGIEAHRVETPIGSVRVANRGTMVFVR